LPYSGRGIPPRYACRRQLLLLNREREYHLDIVPDSDVGVRCTTMAAVDPKLIRATQRFIDFHAARTVAAIHRSIGQ
jgi:hypothetical protein